MYAGWACYGLSVDCAPLMYAGCRKCMRRGPEGTYIDCGRWPRVLCDGFACYNPSQRGVRGSHHTQKYVICLPIVSALSCIVLAPFYVMTVGRIPPPNHYIWEIFFIIFFVAAIFSPYNPSHPSHYYIIYIYIRLNGRLCGFLVIFYIL